MPSFKDLANMPEDDRIDHIGNTLRKIGPGHKIAVCVDKIKGKKERYIRKLAERFPDIEVIGTFDGPVPDVETIQIQLKENQ